MSVLCATDFSLAARSAAEVAAALARRLGERLLLVHAAEPAAAPAAEARLKRLADEIERPGIEVHTQVVAGPAAAAILTLAAARPPRLIVLGSHGRSGPARLFVGSVASEVAGHAVAPVLVVRAGAADPGRWAEGPLRVTAAADGSSASEAALRWLAGSPLAPAETTVVRVHWPPAEARRYGVEQAWLGSEGHPQLMGFLQRELGPQLAALSERGPTRLVFRSASVFPEQPLLAEARAAGADLLVVGVAPHGARTWNAVDAGQLLQQSALPVLCVPQPPAPAGATIPALRTVLVATDLSPPATRAVAQAFELVRGPGGRVEICHVHERGSPGGHGELPLLAPLTETERAAVVARLQALIPPGAAKREIAAVVTVAEGDRAPDAILQAAERCAADLIVIGSHGRSGIKRALLGSVAETVARRARRPVLVVRLPNPQ